jgi:hypothetical protein
MRGIVLLVVAVLIAGGTALMVSNRLKSKPADQQAV